VDTQRGEDGEGGGIGEFLLEGGEKTQDNRNESSRQQLLEYYLIFNSLMSDDYLLSSVMTI
jgi:hypothetical protein